MADIARLDDDIREAIKRRKAAVVALNGDEYDRQSKLIDSLFECRHAATTGMAR